jgi:hypothetical protein
MSEEKKEEKKEEVKAAIPEAPAASAPETKDAPPAAKAEAAPQAAAAETPPAEAPKKEKPSACVGCKKSIKKKRWYYRDGKYYCTKRCWNTTVKKADKKDEAPAAKS